MDGFAQPLIMLLRYAIQIRDHTGAAWITVHQYESGTEAAPYLAYWVLRGVLSRIHDRVARVA